MDLDQAKCTVDYNYQELRATGIAGIPLMTYGLWSHRLCSDNETPQLTAHDSFIFMQCGQVSYAIKLD